MNQKYHIVFYTENITFFEIYSLYSISTKVFFFHQTLVEILYTALFSGSVLKAHTTTDELWKYNFVPILSHAVSTSSSVEVKASKSENPKVSKQKIWSQCSVLPWCFIVEIIVHLNCFLVQIKNIKLVGKVV